MRDKELEEKVYNYIKEHEEDNVDIVDVVCAISDYGGIKILDTISDLRVNKFIDRVDIVGNYYKYVILKPYEKK